MGYLDTKIAQARALVGKRIEIPVHYNAWMQGARFGTVTGHSEGNIRVAMDHPSIRKPLTVWRLDLECVRVLPGVPRHA